MKILICGLPGSGKTTLANALAPLIDAVVFNGDTVRDLFADKDFSREARIRQASRMSTLCEQVAAAGHNVIADFVCPTKEAREAFGADHTIWCDTIKPEACRYPDTAAMFEEPLNWRYRVQTFSDEHVQRIADILADDGNTAFDWEKPTALFVGRFQPFHKGHVALVAEGIKRTGQACIAVRSMPKSDTDPFSFTEVRLRARAAMAEAGFFLTQYAVIRAPNIGGIFYGRDVGYAVERIKLNKELEAIRGRDVRRRGG